MNDGNNILFDIASDENYLKHVATKEKNVKLSTLKHDLCINCGICKVSCPNDAITMKFNKYGELNPKINNRKCTNCKICVEHCPNTKEKMLQEALTIGECDNPNTYGIQEADYFLAWNSCDSERIKSASGGAITKLCQHLLENNIVDAIIHTERLEAKRDEPHYGACISTTVEEVKRRASSSYQPIDFSKVLSELDPNKTYFVTGTPCVIKGLKKYFLKQNINAITCALVCSHNVNGQFVDYFAKMHKIQKNTPFKINLRNKDGIPDANQYNNHIYTEEKDLLKMNRFKSGWTNIWRSYYFAMNACNFCSDFWGSEADISIKDAWGEWASDPLGKSIAIVRNEKVKELFLSCGLEIEELSYEKMEEHQKSTSDFKQKEAKNRNFKSIFSRNNRKNNLLKFFITSKVTKFLYKNFGYKTTRKCMKIIENITQKDDLNWVLNSLEYFFISLRKVFIFKKVDRENYSKQILMAGGYGYSNTGDEAQCSATAKILRSRYPDYQLKIVTPNPDYSHKTHGEACDFASRTMFYNLGRDCNCFDIDNSPIKKIWFLCTGLLLYINAFLVRADLPTVFINARKASFLEQLKDCSLLFFCGGGYLTGKTLSRLWDGILLCRLCHLFHTPVVMSGQTIGVWDDKFNKKFAKWGFKYVDVITVRDEEFSLKDLSKIGLSGKKIYATHDDALFCEKSDEKFIEGEYIAINFHYWGVEKKADHIRKIHEIMKHILKDPDARLVFAPMHPVDLKSYEDYIKKFPDDRFECFKYDFNFRKIRKVIADSKLCITMKHHPIIFALGEDVPVICLDFSDYYIHKNVGALGQYGQERFSVNLEKGNYLETFVQLYQEQNNNRESIVGEIITSKQKLIERKNKFLKDVDEVLKVK